MRSFKVFLFLNEGLDRFLVKQVTFWDECKHQTHHYLLVFIKALLLGDHWGTGVLTHNHLFGRQGSIFLIFFFVDRNLQNLQ